MKIKSIKAVYRNELIVNFGCEFCGMGFIGKGENKPDFFQQPLPNRCPGCKRRSVAAPKLALVEGGSK